MVLGKRTEAFQALIIRLLAHWQELEGITLMRTGRPLSSFTFREACSMVYAYMTARTPDQVRMQDYVDNAVYGVPIPKYGDEPSSDDLFDEDKQKWLAEQSAKYGIPEMENNDPEIPVNDPTMVNKLDELDW